MAPIQYIVEGGHRLSGTIEPSGNKNSALPIIAAALLTEHPVTLENVPRIRDTETLVELVRSVGASAEWRERNTLLIHAREIRATDLDPDLCARIRASILLAGPLLARCGEVALPPPGGDVIGRRRLDTHFLAFEQLGATVTATHRLEFRASRLTGADVFLDEPSVTATENALVAAVGGPRHHLLAQRRLRAACAGSREFSGRARREDRGHRHQHHRSCTARRRSALRRYTIQPDHIEVGSLIGLAAVTRSPLRIARAGVEHLRSIRMGFERLGIVCGVEGDDLVVPSGQTMKIQDDFGGHVPKLEDQPWPAFPADLMSIAIVTATQCDGVILMFEKMFEVADVLRRQADRDGRRASCCATRTGRSWPARAGCAARSMTSPDIRAGMAMLLAAVCAEGTSHHQQRRPDRARLRADRGTAQRARRQDHAGAGADGKPRLKLVQARATCRSARRPPACRGRTACRNYRPNI